MGAFRKKEDLRARAEFLLWLFSLFFLSEFCQYHLPSHPFSLPSPDNPTPWVTNRRKSPSTSCPTPSLPTSRMPLKESTRREPVKFPPLSWAPSLGCWAISLSLINSRSASKR